MISIFLAALSGITYVVSLILFINIIQKDKSINIKKPGIWIYFLYIITGLMLLLLVLKNVNYMVFIVPIITGSLLTYTDHYTGKVYVFPTYISTGVGMIAMIITGDINLKNLILLFIAFILCLAMFFCKAYSFGDMEIFLSYTPYLILIGLMVDITFILYYFVYVFILAIMCNIKNIIQKKYTGPLAAAFNIAFISAICVKGLYYG